MGARPTALLVGLGLPGDTEVAWCEALADGLADEARRSAPVWSAATPPAPLVVLAVTALGDLGGRPPVTRSGARPGDRVVVAGRLGWAAAGLAVLAAGDRVARRAVVDAHGRPRSAYGAARCSPTPAPPRWSTSATGWRPTSATSPPPPGSAIDVRPTALEVLAPL